MSCHGRSGGGEGEIEVIDVGVRGPEFGMMRQRGTSVINYHAPAALGSARSEME
jgi:hypothetical protein